MLSQTHILANFCFDTAENEPAKKLQDFSRLSIQAEYKFCPRWGGESEAQHGVGRPAGRFPPRGLHVLAIS